MAQEDEPSFGNWIRQGATTLWEYWDGAHSHNHPFFGGGFVWFYRDVAGLAPDPEQPGYRHILVEPKIPAKLESASYALETPYGLASVAWRRAGEGIVLDVVVPVGSTATVRLNGLERELGQGTHRLSAGR
jgi:alpha-L-rhamnosidase